MLKFMREQASSWLIKTILWLVVVAFVGSLFYSYGMGGYSGATGVVAEVLDEKIYYEEYQKALNNLYDFYGNAFKGKNVEDIIPLAEIKKTALNSLIQRRLLLNKAREMGLEVSDQEVIDQIRNSPLLQVNGRFDSNAYENFLKYNRLSAEDFEDNQRKDLLMSKLEDLIRNNVKATELEIRDAYKWKHEKINLDYLVISPDLFEGKEKLTDDDISEFYNKEKNKYRVQNQIKVEYLFAEPVSFEKDVRIDEEDLSEYYADYRDDFEEKEKVRASHILFRKTPTDLITDEKMKDAKEKLEKRNQEAKVKAEDLLADLKKEGNFEESAKKFSQDTATAKKGGDVGFFARGGMIKEFDNVAFSLKVGEISDVVETAYGYHIIKVTAKKEAAVKPLNEVKEDIRKKLTNKKSKKLAKRALLKIQKSKNSINEFNQYDGSGLVKRKNTDFFSMKKDSHIPLIGDTSQFKLEAFSLKENEISRVVETDRGFYLLKLLEKKESYIPQLEEVKDQVKKSLSRIKQNELARKEADRLLEQLKNGTSMDSVAEKLSIETGHTELFDRDQAMSKFRMDKGFLDTVFQVNKKEFAVVPVLDKFYLVYVIDRTGLNEEEYKKDKKDFLRTFIEKKRSKVLSAWLENLRENSDVTVNEQIL